MPLVAFTELRPRESSGLEDIYMTMFAFTVRLSWKAQANTVLCILSRPLVWRRGAGDRKWVRVSPFGGSREGRHRGKVKRFSGEYPWQSRKMKDGKW